jgi:hypothetical protein
MKSHLTHGLLAGLFVVALGATGCMTPNTREVEIGMVSARARLVEGKATFYELEIHKPMADTAPRILLQLPDGKIIDRTGFSYLALKQAGFLGEEGNDYNPSNVYSHQLSRYGASFFYNQGTLMMIRISQTAGPSVSFAGERKKIFRTLPLTQEELEKLFGRPDKTADSYNL